MELDKLYRFHTLFLNFEWVFNEKNAN